jgi:predicted Rossmann fold flavoprotein
MNHVDVIIIGAGAAGLMCGIEAGARGRRVLILDKSNKPGKKILMSGGGRCNFTHTHTTPEQFLSHNPHFCKSALSRYTPWDFIALVERHKIAYVEKTPGQLFCRDKAHLIVDMLLSECKKNHVSIQLNQTIQSVTKKDNLFSVQTNQGHYSCDSLVVASGGLSIPSLGSSPIGYQLATQFGLKVHPTSPGLVPLTLHTQDKERFESLAGISVETAVECHHQSFRDHLLFTHRGLSGPAILQISSFWTPGSVLNIKCLPHLDLYVELQKSRQSAPDGHVKTLLNTFVAKKLLPIFIDANLLEKPLKQCSDRELKQISQALQSITIKPNATEGYRTAEVTLGGVDCNELSSQRFESNKVPGLYFVGEVIDVTGWLGGYNFQWAWASGWAAGQVA